MSLVDEIATPDEVGRVAADLELGRNARLSSPEALFVSLVGIGFYRMEAAYPAQRTAEWRSAVERHGSDQVKDTPAFDANGMTRVLRVLAHHQSAAISQCPETYIDASIAADDPILDKGDHLRVVEEALHTLHRKIGLTPIGVAAAMMDSIRYARQNGAHDAQLLRLLVELLNELLSSMPLGPKQFDPVLSSVAGISASLNVTTTRRCGS